MIPTAQPTPASPPIREKCERCGNRSPAADFREIGDGWRVCGDCFADPDLEPEATLPERCARCGGHTAALGVCERCYSFPEPTK